MLTSGLWLCSIWHPLPKGFHLDSVALDTNYKLVFSSETSSLSTNHSCHYLTHSVDCFIKSSTVTLISYVQIGPPLISHLSECRSSHRPWSLSWFLPFPQLLLPQSLFLTKLSKLLFLPHPLVTVVARESSVLWLTCLSTSFHKNVVSRRPRT